MDTSAPWRALEVPEAGTSEAPTGRSGSTVFVATIAIAAILAIVSLAVVAFVEMGPSGRVEVISGPAASGSPVPSAPMLVVQVAGAVLRPGVFSLPQGSRVADAIRAAGGYSPDVDPRQAESRLNLAAKLVDAQLIVVPRRGDTASGPAGSAVPAPSGPININTASPEQLDTLPGIGPATAAKIVAARDQKPFATIDELVTRKIVTASVLAKLRGLATAG